MNVPQAVLTLTRRVCGRLDALPPEPRTVAPELMAVLYTHVGTGIPVRHTSYLGRS